MCLLAFGKEKQSLDVHCDLAMHFNKYALYHLWDYCTPGFSLHSEDFTEIKLDVLSP